MLSAANCTASYHSTLPRRNLSCHCNLHCGRLPSSIEPLVKRAGKPPPCLVQHHPSICNPQSHSNSRMVSTPPIAHQFHPVDDLQWQPTTGDFCTRVGSCRNFRGHSGSDLHHLEPRRAGLESVVRHWVHDRGCHSDCRLEGHVCGQSDTLLRSGSGAHMEQVLHGMHHRHLRPWELFAEGDDSSGDVELKKGSFDTMGSSNSYEDEPWVAKYEKRNLIRKIFDREVWIQEPALRQIQDTIFLQAVGCALLITAISVAIFVAVPKGNYY